MTPIPPIEYQVLNMQQTAHRTGWDQGKRENLYWAIRLLRLSGYPDAADFLESQAFGQFTSPKLKLHKSNEPTKPKEVNQGPDTKVTW